MENETSVTRKLEVLNNIIEVNQTNVLGHDIADKARQMIMIYLDRI